MAKSIIQAYTDTERRECFLCRFNKPYADLPHKGLDKHHFMHGTANRKLAEKWGLWGNISGQETFQREYTPLLQIRDAYPKMIIARTKHPMYTYEGIEVHDIVDWLSAE